MKRKGARLLMRKLAKMTPAERRAFWKSENEKLAERIDEQRSAARKEKVGAGTSGKNR